MPFSRLRHPDPSLVNISNNNFETALHFAVRYEQSLTVKHLMSVVDLASLQAWDKNGLCPLHIAIMLTKSLKCVTDGSSSTHNIKVAMDSSDAPLFILDLLLRHKDSDPNLRTEAGYTPAMVATCLMIPAALRKLLQYKADIR